MPAKKYNPIDLFNETDGVFRCPKCNATAAVGKTSVRLGWPSRLMFRCKGCNEDTELSVKPWRRKRIYLDQSLLSDLARLKPADFEADSPEILPRLHAKLLEAKQRQLIFIVVSDTHVSETAAVPKEENKKLIWEFSNELADGYVGGDLYEALFEELARIVGIGHSDELVASLRFDPDEIKPASPVLSTNSWRFKLVEPAPSNDKHNDAIRAVYERQKADSAVANSSSFCITYIENLYCAEIKDAAKFVTDYVQWRIVADAAWKQGNSSPPLPNGFNPADPNGYERLVFQLASKLGDYAAQIDGMKKVQDEVNTNGLANIQSFAIRAAIEGELLWSWHKGARQKPGDFNAEYGTSRSNDTSHISVFARLCDVVTTDNDMLNLCCRSQIAAALQKYHCQLFAKKTYDSFERYLDALLQTPESKEQMATRLLLRGYTNEERKTLERAWVDQVVAKVLQEHDSLH